MARSHFGAALYSLAWIVIGLVVFDAAINILLAVPNDPKAPPPSQVRQYFEYGRSTEGHLARMTRPNPADTAPITLPGWYDSLEVQNLAEKAPNSVVTFYGMSHAVNLARAVGRTSDRLTVRIVGAPGAPTNWSYGAYLRDRGGHHSRAAVLAFMSTTLPMTTTVSAITWSIDRPMPYTSDRFVLDHGELRAIHPPFASFESYVDAFYHPANWAKLRDFLARYDTVYDPFIMHASVLDHSALYRLLRRAYGQRHLRSIRNAVLSSSGFVADSEQVQIARAMIHDFAKEARADGVIPVIYIVNNFGYSTYLYDALKPALEQDHVPYLSSHTVVPPDDPRGYLADSHFTPEVDNRLAKALEKVIVKAMEER